MAERTCSIEGCNRPARARGWCGMHYHRWQDHGDVLRTPLTSAERHARHVDRDTTPDGCWLWTGTISNGKYGRHDGRSAHRFALEQAMGRPILPGMHALHTCDTPACVRNDVEGWHRIGERLFVSYGHLFEGTTQDNTADQVAKGRTMIGDRNPAHVHPERMSRGERQHLAKLTDDDVRTIRRRAAGGTAISNLATEYGVWATTIYAVVNRETWTHI